ncbi:MAG: MATE family efflux transporter [Theionarchaea archaeon]|nr:MATE family efflux transporter [Theionarchaea archaeon]MBU7038902.1 MATE family efflux transporter [Theionarchaea archaeon]
MAEERIRLESDEIFTLLIRLSVPGIISMFIQALYSVVDSIWVGHLNKEALAALSLAFPVQMVLIAVAVGTGVGVTSLMSRLIGQGNVQKASNAAEHGILIALLFGGLAFVAGYVFSSEIIALFSNDPVLTGFGSDYIRIILIGSTALFIPMMSNAILRGEGNTFIPMVTMLIGSVMNMVLDPLFIFGIGPFPRMEVAGAALATVLSRVVSGSFILYILFRGKTLISLDFRHFAYDFPVVKGIFNVGFPSMVMQLLASVMAGSMNIILGGFSATAIAAMGIYFRLQSFVLMPVFGLNQGYLPLVGYNYGHRNFERIKKTVKYGIMVAFSFTVLGFCIFQFIPSQLVRLFNDNPELVNTGTQALKTISYLYPVVGLTLIASVTFQAFGKAFRSLGITVFRQLVLLLPLAVVFGRVGGLPLIWYAFPVAEVIGFGVAMMWFRKTLQQVERELSTGL